MTEEEDFETYLSITKNKFEIFLFDKKNHKDLYKDALSFKSEMNFIDSSILPKFLDDNIYKIEKLVGKFIKNIILIIDSEEIFFVDIGIKKKSYNNTVNKKHLENILTELKDLFKENYQDQHIMHMVVSNYLINEKNYSLFENDLESDHLGLEVNFIYQSNNQILMFEKILEKYQIKINQYLDGRYLASLFKEKNYEISTMAYKIRNGYNENEVALVVKDIENKGFFEKFFQLLS